METGTNTSVRPLQFTPQVGSDNKNLRDSPPLIASEPTQLPASALCPSTPLSVRHAGDNGGADHDRREGIGVRIVDEAALDAKGAFVAFNKSHHSRSLITIAISPALLPPPSMLRCRQRRARAKSRWCCDVAAADRHQPAWDPAAGLRRPAAVAHVSSRVLLGRGTRVGGVSLNRAPANHADLSRAGLQLKTSLSRRPAIRAHPSSPSPDSAPAAG
jgi:hypothetical protein